MAVIGANADTLVEAEARSFGTFEALQAAVAAGDLDAPGLVLVAAGSGSVKDAAAFEAVSDACGDVLELAQAWLGASEGRLVLVSRGAASVTEGEVADSVQAAQAALWRSAVTEHPDRFALLDLGAEEQASKQALSVLADGEQPELAQRDGMLLAPRLSARSDSVPDSDAAAGGFDGGGCVVLSGASGGLGVLVARHLVGQGVGRLVLVSRRGGDAPRVGELVAELEGQGVEVVVVAGMLLIGGRCRACLIG